MGRLKDFFTFKSAPVVASKHPTIKQDAIAYTSGGAKEFSATYNDYINSVETVEKCVRICANIASNATLKVYKDVGGELKPLKVNNIDLQYGINETDSQPDFIRKVFSSMFTQGASIILAETSKKSKLVSFYPYDPSAFRIEATESAVIGKFYYTSKAGTEITFDPKDVIYANSTVDVTNLVYAVSRLKPLTDMLTLQANIMKQTSDFYATGSKDSVIISPKEPMSATNAETLKTTFNTFIQSRQTRTLFLNADVDVKSVSNAQSPSEIMSALIVINTIIVESFGIPPYLFGNFSGYINDQSITTASRLFFEIQLKPVFNTVAFQMTKYFRDTLGLKNAIVKFDYSDIEILQDNLTMKIDNASKLYKLGALSLDEFRVICELPPLGIPSSAYHFLPAFLVSSTPVPLENYDELVANGLLETTSSNSSTDGTGTGASGGTDNETQLTAEDKLTEPSK